MIHTRTLLAAIILAVLVLSPLATFARTELPASLSQSVPVLGVAAVGASDPIGLNTIKDSVLRIGVELRGDLYIPYSDFDSETGLFVPSRDVGNEGSAVTSYRLGTGFVVDPAGYLITNAHVVDTGASVTDDLWNEYQDEVWNDISSARSDLTYDQVSALATSYLAYAATYGTWSNTTYNIVVFNPASTDAVGDIQELFKDGWNAEIKKIGQPYPIIGKDVAIIKVESDHSFAPLILGDSSSTVAGSTVYVIGYPSIADLSDKSFLVPTVTSGIVSAIKASDLGNYKVIQVDAGIEGGNSGGPVLNTSGHVIGIATFGATEAEGYNWALPIELAKEYLNELNIAPKSAQSTSGLLGFINRVPVLYWVITAFIIILITVILGVFIIRKRHHHVVANAPVFQSPPQV